MKKLNPSSKPLLKPLATVALVACALCGTGLALYPPLTHGAVGEPAAVKPALTVTTAQPRVGRLPVTLVANGNVAAWQEASVSSEANGLRLTEVRVNVGDVVRAGDVLAVFSPDVVLADLALAKAKLQEARANATDAAANAARARGLRETGALSQQQLSQYATAEQTADARIASAEAALVAQQVRLRQTRVLAPDGGVVSARAATVGAVPASGAELFRMVRRGRLEWRAEVVASDLRRIRAGMDALVRSPDGREVRGRVRMIAPTVDSNTRSALVYVDLPADGNAGAGPFKSGMFASGRFELGASEAITVPQQAIVVRDGFSYVFQVNPDQHVSQLRVQPGRRVGDRIEIVHGVAATARLVVRGAGFLNDGDVVRNAGNDRDAT